MRMHSEGRLLVWHSEARCLCMHSAGRWASLLLHSEPRWMVVLHSEARWHCMHIANVAVYCCIAKLAGILHAYSEGRCLLLRIAKLAGIAYIANVAG